MLLVYFLLEQLNLTGTHIGCDNSQCRACTRQINGQAVKSCTVLAARANGAKVKTIEGLAEGDTQGVLAPNAKLRSEIIPSPPEHEAALK